MASIFFFNACSFNLTKESAKYLSSRFLSSLNLFLTNVISFVFGIKYGVTIITKLFFFELLILFLNNSPNKGISPKTGTFWFVDSILFSINPPIITLSPLFKIVVVFICFFEVSAFPLIVWVVLTPSKIASISKVTFVSFEILGFTFNVKPTSSLS